MIKIYDTMTRSLRDFVPLTENVVNMYVCGPTVYNYIHIGNARSTVAFDTIRRYFEYRGYTVNYISNFTDVDDKIIKAANEVGIFDQRIIRQVYHSLYGRYRTTWNQTSNTKSSCY